MDARPAIGNRYRFFSPARWMPRGGLIRHALTLASGVVFAQVAMVLCAPLLARLYGPVEFAQYALFAVFANLMAILATGRFEFAVMVPEQEEDAEKLLVLAGGLPIVLSLSTATGLFACWLIHPDWLPVWSVAVPLGIVLLAWSMVGARWQARMKRFRCIAVSEAVTVGVTLAVQLGAGLWQANPSGMPLIVGQILGRLISLPILFRGLRQDLKKSHWQMRAADVWQLVVRYRHFPLYSCGSSFIGKANQELPKLMLAGMFGTHTLGLYSLGMRVLGTPAGFIGQTLGDAFFPKISESRQDPAVARGLIARASLTLFFLILPPALVLGIWAERLFAFAFGPQWAEAGSIARLLLPLFIVQFVVQPIALAMHAFGRQRAVLVWQCVSLVLLPLTLLLGKLAGDVGLALFSYAMASAAMLLIYLAMSLHYAENAGPIDHGSGDGLRQDETTQRQAA